MIKKSTIESQSIAQISANTQPNNKAKRVQVEYLKLMSKKIMLILKFIIIIIVLFHIYYWYG